MQIRKLPSPESVGWARKLEMQGKANFSVQVESLLDT
jgi:hypothetical protein